MPTVSRKDAEKCLRPFKSPSLKCFPLHLVHAATTNLGFPNFRTAHGFPAGTILDVAEIGRAHFEGSLADNFSIDLVCVNRPNIFCRPAPRMTGWTLANLTDYHRTSVIPSLGVNQLVVNLMAMVCVIGRGWRSSFQWNSSRPQEQHCPGTSWTCCCRERDEPELMSVAITLSKTSGRCAWRALHLSRASRTQVLVYRPSKQLQYPPQLLDRPT